MMTGKTWSAPAFGAGVALALAGAARGADPIPNRAEPGAISYLAIAVDRGTAVATIENPSSPTAQTALASEKSAQNALNAVWNQTALKYMNGTATAAEYLAQLNGARWQAYSALVWSQQAYFQKPTWSSTQATIASWYAYTYLNYALTMPLPPSNGLSAEMQALLAKHNAYRQSAGLAALAVDSRLQASAVGHANWMAANQTMSHTESDGSQPLDRAVRQGFSGASYGVGENIAYGYPDVDTVFAAWVNSPEHQQDIVNTQWTSIGLSAATASNGTRYWTVEFGFVR